MKNKIIALLLTFVMLLSSFTVPAAGDTPITTADAILILQHLIGLSVEPDMERHDLDDSETITITDAVLLLRQLNDAEPYLEANKLSVVSYNIRYCSDGTGLMIADRAPRLKQVLDEIDPDVMGFQEVTRYWMTNFLSQDYSDEYDYIYKYRASYSEEGTPIFWKKDKFELLDNGHFWLSDTPDVESKGWDGKHPRICSWVKLKIKATGAVFLFYNTHYDFSETCAVNSSKLILKRAAAAGGFTQYPVFCTADFNMEPNSAGYNTLVQGGLSDINAMLDNNQSPTNNGYHKTGVTPKIIDFCFYSDNLLMPLKYELIDKYVQNGYVSDHVGLHMELAIRKYPK